MDDLFHEMLAFVFESEIGMGRGKARSAASHFADIDEFVGAGNILTIANGLNAKVKDHFFVLAQSDLLTKKCIDWKYSFQSKHSGQKELNELLKGDYQLCYDLHITMLQHGQKICRRKPLCEQCVISHLCDYYKQKVKDGH